MFLSLLSPLGGRPLRDWAVSQERGKPNLHPVDRAERPIINEESVYCIKVGYLEDGTKVLMKDRDAYQLYRILRKHYT